MLIFIDTNIFFKNWQLKNADFTFLFNFITNESGKLLMSELVVAENESNRQKELETAKSLIEKNVKYIDSMSELPVKIDLSTTMRPYSFKSLLEDKLETEYIEYLSYNSIQQEEVVKRAIHRVRPFKESEKGYRDTLIWLSFLDYLSSNEIKDDVAFISNNSDDFLNSKKTEFHHDLLADISKQKLQCKITPYNSLFSFIAAHVDKNEHQLAYNELDKVEDQIEEYTIDVLNNWSTDQLKKSLEEQYPRISSLLSIEDHNFTMDEGLEDGKIVNMTHIKGRMVYVNYQYNLRRCTLKVILSREEYNHRQSTLPKWHNSEEANADYIAFEIYLRLYFNSSFEYDTEHKVINGFTVNTVNYR